jgi:hypothetical protein
MEPPPCCIVGLTHRGQERHATRNSRCKRWQQAAAEALGPSESVYDEKINAIGDRCVDRAGGGGQTPLIEPAAPRAGAPVLPNIENGVGAQVDDVNGLGTAAFSARRNLQEPAQVDAQSGEPLAQLCEQMVDIEAARVSNRGKAGWLG